MKLRIHKTHGSIATAEYVFVEDLRAWIKNLSLTELMQKASYTSYIYCSKSSEDMQENIDNTFREELLALLSGEKDLGFPDVSSARKTVKEKLKELEKG